MSDRADQLVVGASTGQRKRIALARSLLHDPEVLFLDEPTSGLDPAAIRDVVALIDSLAAEQGRTVVLCTHFLGEADELADRMAMLHLGRLEAFGRPAELAAQLWSGVAADIELGGPPPAETADRVRAVRGVQCAEATDLGLALTVDAYDVIPQVVAELVHAGASVFAARPATRTVSDIYFEIERRREDDAMSTADRPWAAVRAVIIKDVTAVRRSKAVVLPMLLLPAVMLLGLPVAIGIIAANSAPVHVDQFLSGVPAHLADPILNLPLKEQSIVLVLGYLHRPAVPDRPAHGLGGARRRRLRRREGAPHPRDAAAPADLGPRPLPGQAAERASSRRSRSPGSGSRSVRRASATPSAWPVMHRMFLPDQALDGDHLLARAGRRRCSASACMVRVSARARTTQEANQLGGTVILPLVIGVVGQTSTLLLADLWITVVVGAVIWAIALWLNVRGARRFTRDRLAARL